MCCKFRLICLVLDHDIFIKDSIVGDFDIVVYRFHELVERVDFGYRHEFFTEFLIRSMKGNRQFDWYVVLDKLLDARDDACCRDGNMSFA